MESRQKINVIRERPKRVSNEDKGILRKIMTRVKPSARETEMRASEKIRCVKKLKFNFAGHKLR
jgi:hypothetical protein